MTSNTENEIASWEADELSSSDSDLLHHEEDFHNSPDDENQHQDGAPPQSRKGFMLMSFFRVLVTAIGLVGAAVVVWFVARNTETAQPFTSSVETKCAKVWDVITSNDDQQAEIILGKKGEALTPVSSATLMHSSVKPFVVSLSDNQVSRTFTGTLKATQTSDLGFNRTGTIENVRVSQGDSVKKGSVLAELDIKQLKAQIAILEAQRKVEKAKLSELVAGPRVQTIESARSILKEQEAIRDQAQLNANRQLRLIRDNASAQQDVDDARKTLEAAHSRVKSQRLILEELEAGTRSEQIDAQQALIERLNADVASVNVKILESRLVAPFDGIVSARNVDDGAIVLPGAIIMRLVESKIPEAWIGIPASLVSSLSPESQYVLTSDDREWSATFKSIKPELDRMTRTQTVIFRLKNLPNNSSKNESKADALGALPALGQIVRLELPLSAGDGMWIPRTALIQSTEGIWAVFKIEQVATQSPEQQKQWIVVRKNVSVERIDSDRVLVTGEISTGDSIVAEGVHRLTPGQNVRPDESSAN
ncbi:MAG: efflux RND transporter periplasmic adaptor subunit [Mariniblastus sp.]